METTTLGVSHLQASRLAYGCWRIAGSWDPGEVTDTSRAQGVAAVQCAFDSGYTLFDTADIYTSGESERLLGQALRETPGMREKILITTKCGVRFAGSPEPSSPARYDLSAEHIIASCEGSLSRMGISSIDLFLLHRPDYLIHPDEVAGAFSRLQRDGKVRQFGVSNFKPSLVTALQVACPMPLIAHQVEMSLLKLDPLEDGTLDQCLIEKITPMAWSPLGAGILGAGSSGLLPSQQKYNAAALRPVLEDIASAHGVSAVAVAIAWLLKHPAGVMPVVGTVKPDRIRDAARAPGVKLTRDEWYRLLLAARGEPLP